jgi:hypothetical protein
LAFGSEFSQNLEEVALPSALDTFRCRGVVVSSV